MFPKGTITVDMFGKAFVQANEFYAVSHGRVNMLMGNDDLSIHAKQFLVTVIDNEASSFGFTDMCNSSTLSHLMLALPSTMSGKPDWQYMEDYMKSVEQKAKHTIDMLITG